MKAFNHWKRFLSDLKEVTPKQQMHNASFFSKSYILGQPLETFLYIKHDKSMTLRIIFCSIIPSKIQKQNSVYGTFSRLKIKIDRLFIFEKCSIPKSRCRFSFPKSFNRLSKKRAKADFLLAFFVRLDLVTLVIRS